MKRSASILSNKYFEEYNMKIKPLADRVLAKPEKAESKTAAGIIIPDAAQEKTQTAIVEAVGPGTDKEKIFFETSRLLIDAAAYMSMSKVHNPYGDGKAAPKIVKFIQDKNQ